MAMSKSTLHTAIKNTAESYISKHKTYENKVKQFKVEDGKIIADADLTTSEIPPGDDGIKAIIDIIAEAVAQEVILHIKGYMELNVPAQVTATLPSTTPLNGVGGGVVGPVQVFPQPISVQGGTITIPKAPSADAAYFK